jgi:hypothetical protein
LRQVRNLPDDKQFHLRIEYHKPSVLIYTWNYDNNDFEACITMDVDLSQPGVWMITAGNGMKNADHVYLDVFALYDQKVEVSESHNQHIHDAHKKKAKHDMDIFEKNHLVKDLMHNDMSFFNQKLYDEDHMLDMIPVQLTMTKKTMSTVLKEMYNNLNYYYQLTNPLHNNKNYEDQVYLV